MTPLRRATLLALLIPTLAASPAPAQQKYRYIGLGDGSCGSWTSYRSTQQAGAAEQWVLGFLSGVGYARAPAFDPLHGVDGFGVLAWMDNYCQSHPLSRVEQAAIAFTIEHPH